MKIALVTYRADASRGGAEHYTIKLAEALAAQGHTISVLHAVAADSRPHDRINYRAFPVRGIGRAAKYRDFRRQIERHIASENYDIVHAMLPVQTCDIYQPHAGLAINALVSDRHKQKGAFGQLLARFAAGLNRKRQADAMTERTLLNSSHAPTVICLSYAMQAEIESCFPNHRSHLAVVPNAVDLTHFDPVRLPGAGPELRRRLNIGSDQKVGLFVGNDFKRKGLAETIRATAALNDPLFLLVVVGRDDDKPFRQEAATLGIGKQVLFTGPSHDPYDFYAASDCVLFPSFADPFGLVPAEALAMGVPSIVSRVSGVSECLSDGDNAILINDPANIESLRDAIRQTLDPGTHSQLADGCLRSRKIFSYDVHLNAIQQLYQTRIELKAGGSLR